MNRRDIDAKLMQLCNARKEDNDNLIGSYGVGFLSVFAFKPNAVIVDTGREGEAMRLIFKENRKFDRVPLEVEFTGTRVQVQKEIRALELEDLRLELKSTLKRWCRMVTIELRFEGEPINECFSYAEDLAWTPDGSGDTFRRLTVRPRTDEDSHYEFYCNGFLIEKDSDEKLSLPGLSYRVDSSILRYLPSRDKVERDDNLGLVLDEVRRTVESRYVPHLIRLLANSPNDDAYGVISHYLPSVSKKDAEEAILRASDGSKLSLLELARQVRGNKLFWSSKERDSKAVLWDGKSPGLGRLLRNVSRVRGSMTRRVTSRLYPPRDVELVEQP